MRTTVLTADADLPGLAPEWDALWRRAAASATPFASPAWLLPWWGAFGTGRPLVATLRDDGGALLGVLPLYLLEEDGTRKALPIGVGITDYHDLLLDPAAPPDAAAVLLAAGLDAAARAGAASLDLPDLPPGAALRDAPAPPGWREERWDGEPCPVLLLPEGSDPVRRAVRPSTWRHLKLARNRAAKAGGWTVSVAAGDDAAPAWDTLARLHHARWTERGEEGGVLSDPRVLAFHDAAIPALDAAGALRLHVLRLGGEVAAAYHTLPAGPDRLLFYLSAFDTARTYESPGALLLGHVLEAAAAEGRRELHFLCGAEAYKYAWGATDRMNLGRRFLPA